MALQLREVIPNNLQSLYRMGPGLPIPFCENGKHAGFIKDCRVISKREKPKGWNTLPNDI